MSPLHRFEWQQLRERGSGTKDKSLVGGVFSKNHKHNTWRAGNNVNRVPGWGANPYLHYSHIGYSLCQKE